ncbi:methyltransferase, partial [Klebsiella pneumoniae]|uniref:methyltransferase n=1 Tax=Klebsiella pneumoniae TaxID=573 RepID=UPI00222E8C24
ARLLVVEHVVPTTHGPHFAKFMDMNMLALTAGGRERTEAAFARLLTEAGLTLRRTVPTAIDIAVLECTAA